MKGLKYNLQVSFVHMNFTGKRFNEVLDYVKKLAGVTQGHKRARLLC